MGGQLLLLSTGVSLETTLLPPLLLLPSRLPFGLLCARLSCCFPVTAALLCSAFTLETTQSAPHHTPPPSSGSPDFSAGQNGGIKTKSLFHASKQSMRDPSTEATASSGWLLFHVTGVPHQQNEGHDGAFLYRVIRRLNELAAVMHLEQWLARGKHHVHR